MSFEPGVDPKLKLAMAEIEAVCRKYEIGAFAALFSKTHGEFRILTPGWSLWREDNPGRGDFRLKYKGPACEQLDQTTAMIYGMRDITTMTAKFLQNVAREIEKVCEVTHHPFKNFEPHDPKKHGVN